MEIVEFFLFVNHHLLAGADGFQHLTQSLVLLQKESVADALGGTDGLDEFEPTLGGKVVLDEEKIVQAGLEGKKHLVFIDERNQIVDIVVFACRVIEKGVFGTLKIKVVVSCKVDGELVVDAPSQLVVGQARIDADDGSVVKRRDLYSLVFGIHAAKITLIFE